MKKIFLFLFAIIFLISALNLSSAFLVGTGTLTANYGTSGTGTENGGVNFTTNYSHLTNITATIQGTATRLQLKDNSGSVLATASITGGTATITYNFVPGTFYWLVADNSGGSYNYYYDGSPALPKNSSVFQFLNPIFYNAPYSSHMDWGFNILSITGYDESGAIITLNQTSPENNSVISEQSTNFQAIYNISSTNFNWSNATTYIWYQNGTLFNSTTSNITGQNNITNVSIDSFSLGTYYWNVYGCYVNSTFVNCTFASKNYTLNVGATTLSEVHTNNTWETSQETFTLNLQLFNGSQVSLAQLVYGGTTYTISDINSTGNQYTFTKTLDIPLNNVSTSNITNQYYYKFTYGGNFTQIIGNFTQNVSYIDLRLCGTTRQVLNFTLADESTEAKIVASSNPVNYQSFYTYWLGTGNIYKNYSFITLSE